MNNKIFPFFVAFRNKTTVIKLFFLLQIILIFSCDSP